MIYLQYLFYIFLPFLCDRIYNLTCFHVSISALINAIYVLFERTDLSVSRTNNIFSVSFTVFRIAECIERKAHQRIRLSFISRFISFSNLIQMESMMVKRVALCDFEYNSYRVRYNSTCNVLCVKKKKKKWTTEMK